MPIAAPPFYVSRLPLPTAYQEKSILPLVHESTEVSGLTVELFIDQVHSAVIAVLSNGFVATLEIDSLSETTDPIPYPTAVSGRHTGYKIDPAINAIHATMDRSRQRVYVNRIRSDDLAVVELVDRVSYTMTVGTDVSFVGGVAYNNGWKNPELLAVRTETDVHILKHLEDNTLLEIGRLDVPKPQDSSASNVSSRITGPQFALEWSTSGDYIIAASNNDRSEFAVIKVEDAGATMEIERWLTACPNFGNYPNDIWTANGLVTPSPSPTLSATPPPSDTPSPTSTQAATATSHPSPVYLPLALTESCDPTQIRIDVALAIDASSSMREPVAPGSAQTKLGAALQAAGSFLDILELDEGDQAAIISFSSDAWLHVGLTADRMALADAFAALEPGNQTRLDRAVEVATAALLDGSTRDPDNESVLIILTDGRANPVPVDVAVELADGSKAEGITIFTIGLGEDLEVEELRQMASEPAFFLHAPSPGELAGVYAEVARSIPCPGSSYWGGR